MLICKNLRLFPPEFVCNAEFGQFWLTAFSGEQKIFAQFDQVVHGEAFGQNDGGLNAVVFKKLF